MRRDLSPFIKRIMYERFNPRAYVRRDVQVDEAQGRPGFQSTRLRETRPKEQYDRAMANLVSIHAPT